MKRTLGILVVIIALFFSSTLLSVQQSYADSYCFPFVCFVAPSPGQVVAGAGNAAGAVGNAVGSAAGAVGNAVGDTPGAVKCTVNAVTGHGGCGNSGSSSSKQTNNSGSSSSNATNNSGSSSSNATNNSGSSSSKQTNNSGSSTQGGTSVSKTTTGVGNGSGSGYSPAPYSYANFCSGGCDCQFTNDCHDNYGNRYVSCNYCAGGNITTASYTGSSTPAVPAGPIIIKVANGQTCGTSNNVERQCSDPKAICNGNHVCAEYTAGGGTCDVSKNLLCNAGFHCQNNFCVVDVSAGDLCNVKNTGCDNGYSCQPDPGNPGKEYCAKNNTLAYDTCNVPAGNRCKAGYYCSSSGPEGGVCVPGGNIGCDPAQGSHACLYGYSCNQISAGTGDHNAIYECQKTTTTPTPAPASGTSNAKCRPGGNDCADGLVCDSNTSTCRRPVQGEACVPVQQDSTKGCAQGVCANGICEVPTAVANVNQCAGYSASSTRSVSFPSDCTVGETLCKVKGSGYFCVKTTSSITNPIVDTNCPNGETCEVDNFDPNQFAQTADNCTLNGKTGICAINKLSLSCSQ